METGRGTRTRDLSGALRARVDTGPADFLDGRLRDPADANTAPIYRLVRGFVLHCTAPTGSARCWSTPGPWRRSRE
ncbi:hypothetical protein GCM10010182_02840 [Actinomadura cremea]|nr:hypothetical protein GCM10010182_02840 [Actinomadura cremea]